MLAYIASAIALVVAGAQSADAGMILGVALSLGYAIAVVAQLVVLRWLGCPMRVAPVTVVDCGLFAREGLGVLLAILPGQLSFRFQIVVCAAVLGQASVGLFVYGRQIAAAASQVLEFVRRAHFPDMVRALRLDGATLRPGLEAQRLATMLAVALAFGLMLAGGGCFLLMSGAFAQSALVVALFSVGVLTGALSQTLGQAAQGLGRFRVVAVAAVLAMLVGFAASAGFGALLGLVGLAMAEVVTHVVGALVIWPLVFGRTHGRKIVRVSA
jgi:O-antigen/teichoic acid export membrane protein